MRNLLKHKRRAPRGPGMQRKGRGRVPLKPRTVRGIFRDVEHLAEVAADTVEQLDARGLDELARPLEAALVRLAGRRMPKVER